MGKGKRICRPAKNQVMALLTEAIASIRLIFIIGFVGFLPNHSLVFEFNLRFKFFLVISFIDTKVELIAIALKHF